MKNENKKNCLSDNKENGSIVLAVLGFVFLVVFISSLSLILISEKDKKCQEEEEYIYTDETPQQVLESSKKVMKDIKTVKFSGVMKTDMLIIAESNNIPVDISSSVDLVLAGGIDKTNLDNIKTRFNLDFELDMLSEGGSENISVDLDCISIGKDNLYYRLNDYDLGMMGIMLGREFSGYKGKWLTSGYTNRMSYDLEDDSSPFDLKEMEEIYIKYELLKFEEDLGDEKLGNTEVYHYKVKLDGTSFAGLIEELQSRIEKDNYGMEYSENKSKEELFNKAFENIYIELWIGKRDKFLYQIKIVGNYNTEDFKQIASKIYGESEAKVEDSSTKSKISYIETRLKSHYKNSESYNNFNTPSYYAEKIKPENIITSEDSYVIWKEMALTTDKWCVDSTGKSGYVQEEVKGPNCPETSVEPKGEERDYEEYAYELLEEEMGPDGRIEVGFDLSFSFGGFNEPLNIEEPEDVEKIMGVDSKDVINLSSDFEKENEVDYKKEDIENGYVLGESMSIYNGLEKIFDLFQ